MAEAYVGEIRAVAFDYAPDGWLPCDGRVLPINQYQALFSLLGNRFGGDPVSTFGLPDLRGSAAIGMGKGTYQGASNYNLGNKGGAEQVLLNAAQGPVAAHAHQTVVTDPNFAATGTTNIAPGCNDGARGVVPSNTPVNCFPNALTAGATNYATTANKTMGSTQTAVTVSITKSSAGSVAVQANPASPATQAHENRMPFQVLNFIICVNGYYPPRP